LWFAGIRPAADRPATYEKTVNYSEIVVRSRAQIQRYFYVV
jgi:hypothetical protein